MVPGRAVAAVLTATVATVMSPAAASPHPDSHRAAVAIPEAPAGRIMAIPAAEWKAMVTTGVWRPGCPVGYSGLRRVEVPYWDFSFVARRGALIVNSDVAASTLRIFTRLFAARFPIHRMFPIEAYRGDDNASMAADNTSAFNCRRPGQANAPSGASPHGNGRAIDINPYENPWLDPRCGCWMPSAQHRLRDRVNSKIIRGGLVWATFTAEGWLWQDSSTPDYQHFDTGYPSRPLRATGPSAGRPR